LLIVQNTVAEKIKGKSPDEIATLKICDPACGFGSISVKIRIGIAEFKTACLSLQVYRQTEKFCITVLECDRPDNGPLEADFNRRFTR
jgi:hypothetical protein